MKSCEVCGKRYENMDKAIVEGVLVDVCNACSKFGKIIPVRKPLIEPERVVPIHKNEVTESVVVNFSDVVIKAREKKGLKQEDLAKSIAEKESLIHKIETGSMKPSFIIARKLEQFLGIKLVERIEENKEISLNLKNNELTIGDLLKLKDRKV